jgi:hypothetical protein
MEEIIAKVFVRVSDTICEGESYRFMQGLREEKREAGDKPAKRLPDGGKLL